MRRFALTTLIVGLWLKMSAAAVLAAPISSGDTIISKPAGTGILPGAGTEGTDIQSSVLFVKIIPFLIKWAINLAMGLAVLMIIVGGYMYLTAYGNDDQRQRGTRTLYYALIGLVIAMTAYGIVAVVTNIRVSSAP